MTNLISSTATYNGFPVKYTWIPTKSIIKYHPITQVYGLCLNDSRQILLCREYDLDQWSLPGGTPQKGETIIQTLKRELIEEVDIEVNQLKPLGVQKIDFPHNPNQQQGELFYQARYLCHIAKLLPQTTDPDTGLIYQRKFFPLVDLNLHLKWGVIGDALVSLVQVSL